jgi:biopolymer transport protein TolQ
VATLSTRYYGFGNELQARLHRKLHAASSHVSAAA